MWVVSTFSLLQIIIFVLLFVHIDICWSPGEIPGIPELESNFTEKAFPLRHSRQMAMQFLLEYVQRWGTHHLHAQSTLLLGPHTEEAGSLSFFRAKGYLFLTWHYFSWFCSRNQSLKLRLLPSTCWKMAGVKGPRLIQLWWDQSEYKEVLSAHWPLWLLGRLPAQRHVAIPRRSHLGLFWHSPEYDHLRTQDTTLLG